MAKTKAAEESISGWFRQLYRAEPKWLKTRSNAEVVQRWKDEHPGHYWTDRHGQALANVKSSEKKRQGIGKKRGRKAQAPGEAVPVAKPRTGVGSPEDLELSIDRCLSRARVLEEKEDGMHKVALHLRAARNELILLGK